MALAISTMRNKTLLLKYAHDGRYSIICRLRGWHSLKDVVYKPLLFLPEYLHNLKLGSR